MNSENQTSPFQRAPWMSIARQEIGQKELAGHDDNPRILSYHATTTLKATDDETPWCSSFVNWCLKQAGIKGTDSAAAKSWVHWGEPAGAFPGAITIICSTKATDRSFSTSGAHVGFLIQETATHFRLLGGNQGNSVKESVFPKKSWTLLGRRWPGNGQH
ncbi:TIGR02594 family protein [Geomonas propionica]|uniref:TIGR02594 family protein n=1 Tax=Geomonas propionica TaxID=2798582 RepID=A0ABS0YXP0_9BACT|nr:TIGR02594 family protein [Geomonas propionica]MBJ6802720.1 TIGR02594 family protein [Geomonas propionica]